MTFDWNWFFSSFCQSAAALIGIIGAFIISRLLGLGEKVNSTISNFDNLVIEFNKIKDSLSNRRFEWYSRMNVYYDSDLKKEIKNGDYDKLSREEILDKIYSSDSSLYKADDAIIKEFNEVYAEVKKQGTFSIPTIVPNGLWDNLRREKDAINNLEVEAKTLIQKFKRNNQELKSFSDSIKPLRIIIAILMFAFLFTVIVPLAYMPVGSTGLPDLKPSIDVKHGLLLLFTISIEGMFYYFISILDNLQRKLKHAVNNREEDYENIKNYSQYL